VGTKKYYKYILNCFLLSIPILVWDWAFTSKLPIFYQADIFGDNIPPLIVWGENIFRTLVFLLMFLMPLAVLTTKQKLGLLIYISGLILYITSWLLLIYSPNSFWSTSMIGFMAPAYTPLIWLVGIGMIGDSFYFKVQYKTWFFLLSSILFLVFHNWHTYIVYLRTI
jgi:predicted neutral ceramidase superfamily lipid hydrolase